MIAGNYNCGLWKKRPEAAPFQIRMHPFHCSKTDILPAEVEPIGNTGCAFGKADLRKNEKCCKNTAGREQRENLREATPQVSRSLQKEGRR